MTTEEFIKTTQPIVDIVTAVANSNKGYYKNPKGIIEVAKEFEKYVIQDKDKID